MQNKYTTPVAGSGLYEHVFIEFNGFVQGHNFLLTRASDPPPVTSRESTVLDEPDRLTLGHLVFQAYDNLRKMLKI